MYIHIDSEICKGCGLCIYYCPKEVLGLSEQINTRGFKSAEVVNLDNCVVCRLCEYGCPDLAIYVKKADDAEAE